MYLTEFNLNLIQIIDKMNKIKLRFTKKNY